MFPDWITGLYHYAWFVGFGISGLAYWLLMKRNKIITECCIKIHSKIKTYNYEYFN